MKKEYSTLKYLDHKIRYFIIDNEWWFFAIDIVDLVKPYSNSYVQNLPDKYLKNKEITIKGEDRFVVLINRNAILNMVNTTIEDAVIESKNIKEKIKNLEHFEMAVFSNF